MKYLKIIKNFIKLNSVKNKSLPNKAFNQQKNYQ